jgi:hypothetical protein
MGRKTMCGVILREIPPEFAAKYIPPNRMGRGCGPWVQVLGQEPVMEQGAYLKFRGYPEHLFYRHFASDTAYGREFRERVICRDTEAAAGTVPTQFWPVL